MSVYRQKPPQQKSPQQKSGTSRLIQALAILLLLTFTSGCALTFQPLGSTMEEELEWSRTLGFDGIIVHVDSPQGAGNYAAGYNDRDLETPANPESLFKIASISKLYIAAAASMLIAHGELNLEDTLADLLPSVASQIAYSQDITLRMLLSHRSGIFNFTDHPDFPWDNLPDELSQTYQYFLGQPAQFKPDRRYEYSNTNYFLIGAILDATLGYSHHIYIHDNILVPLGLSQTYSLMSEVDEAEVMSGYIIGYGPDVKSGDYIQPGGSMVATAADVAVFLRALIDGSLLSPEAQVIYSQVYEYEHTGWLPGYTSVARYHDDLDSVVVMFVNTSGSEMFWSKLNGEYRRILRILRR